MVIFAKYDGTCAACGGRFKAGTLVEWARGNGARHKGDCPAKVEAVPSAPAETVSLKSVADFLKAARERGLKFPKARFLAPHSWGELVLSVAGPTSKAPGSIQVKLNREWIGRVESSGAVVGTRLNDHAIIETLKAVAADPAKAAAEYGALVGRCSFCGLGLTDAGSVEMGYGPVCARKWGLPHKAKGTPVLTALPMAVGQ